MTAIASCDARSMFPRHLARPSLAFEDERELLVVKREPDFTWFTICWLITFNEKKMARSDLRPVKVTVPATN